MNALLDYLQAFGGRAQGLLGDPQNYLAEILQSLPDRNSLQGAVKDPEFYKGLLSNTKEVAGGLLTGAVGAPVDIATMMMRPGGYNVPDKQVVGSSNHLAGLLGLDAESTPYKVGSLLPTDAGDAAKYMGLLGQVAWHGSPHKFDKFKLDKIGTGEGAQAYGHGLYFAESPDVARAYQKNLSDNVFEMGGKELRGPSTKYAQTAPSADRQVMSMPEKIATYALDTAIKAKSQDPAADAIKHLTKHGKGNADIPAALEIIRKWSDEGARAKAGAFYKVDIADDAIPRMLDWDKPIDKQPQHIQKLFEGVSPRLDDPAIRKKMTAGEAYGELSGKLGSRDKASAYLLENGVPGIRYLDGASRGKGGTSNFVVFDENLVKILERGE